MSKVAKSAIGLMVVTMLGKMLGFAREMVLASVYGASIYSDAYITASNIPIVIYSSIGAALGTTFIPMYFDIKNNEGDKESLKFTNNIFNIISSICILLTIVSIFFSEQIVKIFAVGFEGEILQIAINFTEIQLLGIVFIALMYMMTSYLQTKGNFVIPGFVSIPKNIITIGSIILSIKYGAYVMVWGTLIGTISQLLLLIPFAVRSGYKFQPYINFKEPYIKKMMLLIGPVFIGVAVNQINAMVDRTLASTLIEGSISALNYANRLNQFVMGLFIASVAAVVYPLLSKLASENNKDKLIQTISTSINSIVIIVVPISVGAIILSKPIVRVLFERGEFDVRATSMTAIALAMYSIGMTSAGLRDVMGKIFYALKDTKTPMVNGAISMVINIILNLFLVKKMGIAGLSLATSLSSIICILLLFRSLNKSIGYFGQDKIKKTFLKSIISAIIMGIVVLFTYKNLMKFLYTNLLSEVIALFISILIGVSIYAIIIIILKVDEVSFIKNKVIMKINK
ncbi:murein biosynthesis integral membrane protein MurJ [Terrisporobacter glycolicus]|nr:murein biosynthesis integral membrane protein MurJ [Terrisporobacter glycolicus]